MSTKCKYAKRYQGSRYPKCYVDGDICELCKLKWDIQQVARYLDLPLFYLKNKDYGECSSLFFSIRSVVSGGSCERVTFTDTDFSCYSDASHR